MESSKVVVGVLGGIAIGAIAGILFAPAKGCKTRKRIMNQGKNYADELKDKFESLYEEITDKYNEVVSETKEMIADNK
jgi:gas vesicle protein